MISHLSINHAHTPAFFWSSTSEESYIYIYGLTLLFFKWLVIANEPKKRIVGGEKRSNVDKIYIYISANLTWKKTTRVYLPCCLGSLSYADILYCDNLSASGPSCYCFFSFFFLFYLKMTSGVFGLVST
jgi:hypothetical protein